MQAGVQVSTRAHQDAIRLEGVNMAFGNVEALRGVNFHVGRNETVGLIGDNGAGKSTLIKIMTGVLQPTAGALFIRDERVSWRDYSVRKAHQSGIETVYQERSLGEKLPLWRNFFVGRQLTNRFGLINIARQKAIAREIMLQHIGFRGGVTEDSKISELSGGERQGVAIGRAMYFDADLIVLDEPTAALGVAEVRKVLSFVQSIHESGRACVYIDHNLANVHEVADRLVVLDRGEVVRVLERGALNVAQLTEYVLEIQKRS